MSVDESEFSDKTVDIGSLIEYYKMLTSIACNVNAKKLLMGPFDSTLMCDLSSS